MGRLMLVFALAVFAAVTRASDWPLPAAELDSVLQRSPRWGSYSEQKQNTQRSQLVYALHLVGSLKARDAFFHHLSDHWDGAARSEEKAAVLKEAESLALQAARHAVDQWVNARRAGKLLSASQITMQLAGGNLATEQFHEWDRFLDEEGRLNLRSGSFGQNTSVPESKRTPTDLLAFAERSYPGSPSSRQEEARKAAAARAEFERKFPSLYHARSTRCEPGTHGSYRPLGSCGTPSSAAPALRPEFNGRQ